MSSRRSIGIWVMLALSSAMAFIVARSAWAQETTAGLQGYVKDQSGGSIPDAAVELTSPALIGNKKTRTDSGGFYRLVNLPPGEYTLSVTASNFRGYKQTGIVLDVGKLP